MQMLTLLKSLTKFPLNNRQQSKYEKKINRRQPSILLPPPRSPSFDGLLPPPLGAFLVVLLKLAASSLPPQTKLNFEQNGWK